MPLRRMLEIGAMLVAGSILAAMLLRVAGAHNMTLSSGQPVFGDFIAFWSAGRAALDGHAEQVHDRALIFSYHKLASPDVRFVAPWNSPPTFLLPMAGFALLPYRLAALLFLTLSGALYLYAARKLLPDARALIFAVTLPAAFFHIGTVQVGLLVAGVSALALHWLDRRPRAAGALVAVLAIKPHLAVLWPIFLALSGRWRAFAAAAFATFAFVLLAGAVFGFDAYARFFENLLSSQELISGQRITTPAYASLYANLLDLGVAQQIATLLHAISALSAVGVAAWVFLRAERAPAGAALCAATLLVSPYLFFYDFTLLAAGAALLGAPRDRFDLAALIFAWGAALSLPLGYFAPLPLCPVAAWLVLINAMRRAGIAAPRPAPALQP
ncbi:MAG: DUF2029 domain-containing protein [Phycisphaerales bacterium]|nr:DUF2029 domain-containing protein [Hyphomonadaceae bacterium]